MVYVRYKNNSNLGQKIQSLNFNGLNLSKFKIQMWNILVWIFYFHTYVCPMCNNLRQRDGLVCLLFNLALERAIRDSKVETTGTIFNKPTYPRSRGRCSEGSLVPYVWKDNGWAVVTTSYTRCTATALSCSVSSSSGSNGLAMLYAWKRTTKLLTQQHARNGLKFWMDRIPICRTDHPALVISK